MSDFISGFFSWGTKVKETIIVNTPKEEVKKEPSRYPRIYQAQKEEE
tara:strand:+ start:527 stop:667 length:141 start_codon:yes stop_codon:yes gene_type:complete